MNHLFFNIDMVEKIWDIILFTSPKKKIKIGCMKNRVELFLSFAECMSVSSCVSPSFLGTSSGQRLDLMKIFGFKCCQ